MNRQAFRRKQHEKTSGLFIRASYDHAGGCIPAPQLCATARGHCASHRPSVDHGNRQRHSPVVPCGLANPSQSRNQQDLLCPAHHHCHVCSNRHRRFICSRRGGVDYGHRRHFGRYDHKPRQKRPQKVDPSDPHPRPENPGRRGRAGLAGANPNR